MAIINSCLVTSNEQEKTTASPKRTSGRFRLFEYSYDVPLLGTITIGCSKKGLRYLRSRHYKYLPEPANREELPLLREAAIEVTAYLKGELYSFADLPLDLKGTELQRAVWKHLMTIPRRETRTSTDLAQEMGKEKGISVESVAVETLSMVRDRTCEGKIVLTPMGTVSSCARVSSPREPLYGDYVYGRVEDGRLVFDQEKFARIMAENFDRRRYRERLLARGNELYDEAVVCVKCGRSVAPLPQQPAVSQDNSLGEVAKVFLILGCIVQGWLLIPLAWCLPITISVFHCLRDNRPVGTGLKVCALLFVSLIGGICLLCMNDGT